MAWARMDSSAKSKYKQLYENGELKNGLTFTSSNATFSTNTSYSGTPCILVRQKDGTVDTWVSTYSSAISVGDYTDMVITIPLIETYVYGGYRLYVGTTKGGNDLLSISHAVASGTTSQSMSESVRISGKGTIYITISLNEGSLAAEYCECYISEIYLYKYS